MRSKFNYLERAKLLRPANWIKGHPLRCKKKKKKKKTSVNVHVFTGFSNVIGNTTNISINPLEFAMKSVHFIFDSMF